MALKRPAGRRPLTAGRRSRPASDSEAAASPGLSLPPAEARIFFSQAGPANHLSGLGFRLGPADSAIRTRKFKLKPDSVYCVGASESGSLTDRE